MQCCAIYCRQPNKLAVVWTRRNRRRSTEVSPAEVLQYITYMLESKKEKKKENETASILTPVPVTRRDVNLVN